MHPEILSSLLIAVALGVGAGLTLRLLRQYREGRHLGFWVFLAVFVLSAYLVTLAAVPDASGTWFKIFLTAAVMLSVNALLQIINVLLWEYFLNRKHNIAVPRLIVDVINFVVLALAAFALLKNVFQVDLNALLVTSTVLSAVVGLSLQDVLGSVVAGLALQMEKPFAVGDYVEIDGDEGEVLQMSWRTISILQKNSHVITYPNSSITKQKITNLSRRSPFMVRFYVGIATSYPPGPVKSTLLSTTRDMAEIRREPKPQVFLKTYDDFSMNYELRFWMDDYSMKYVVLDAVATRIWYALRRSGIEIPFPVRDVNVRMIPEDMERMRKQEGFDTIYSALRSFPLFEGLSDDQIASVSTTSSLLRFSSGESLVVQGETGDSMFLVRSGSLRVEVAPAGDPGAGSVVANLGPGDFFGEMSLLTGEPRSASVVAECDVEVLRLTKADFASVLSTDASVVETLSAALEKRLAENAMKTVSKSDSEEHDSHRTTRADILSRIRGFFGI